MAIMANTKCHKGPNAFMINTLLSSFLGIYSNMK